VRRGGLLQHEPPSITQVTCVIRSGISQRKGGEKKKEIEPQKNPNPINCLKKSSHEPRSKAGTCVEQKIRRDHRITDALMANTPTVGVVL
jgi:hypothetical protein